MTLPTIMAKSGLQPISPADALERLLTAVEAVVPGYTARLPGILIEDISSTDVAAILQMDSYRVELVNSVTPYGANEFLLNQLGQIYGVPRGGPANTSVFCVFTGTVGFVISPGFTISDGGHQYTVQDGGIIATGGHSSPLFCLAVQQGSWAIPQGTVVNMVTSVPSTIVLSVNNPEDGFPGLEAESIESYRSRVLQAGLAASQGMPRYLKTYLGNVSGVQPRLISVVQQEDKGWSVICGGGDPYEVANAIFRALFDISILEGSAHTDRNITVSLIDYPDTYHIVYINPPQQQVLIVATWNTSSVNFVSPTAVAEAAKPELVDYVNSVAVGKPMILYELQTVFQEAVAHIIPPHQLTRLVFAVSIDGVGVIPTPGTGVIAGDPESYFLTNTALVIVNQG